MRKRESVKFGQTICKICCLWSFWKSVGVSEEKSRGVGWWVRVKEMEWGMCRNLIGFGGFVE
jgi:hypothetical protein